MGDETGQSTVLLELHGFDRLHNIVFNELNIHFESFVHSDSFFKLTSDLHKTVLSLSRSPQQQVMDQDGGQSVVTPRLFAFFERESHDRTPSMANSVLLNVIYKELYQACTV